MNANQLDIIYYENIERQICSFLKLGLSAGLTRQGKGSLKSVRARLADLRAALGTADC